MKKSDFKFETIVKNIVKGDEAARSVPFGEGDDLYFTLSNDLLKARKEIIGNEEREWTDIVMDDGSAISASQITRNRNGLNLKGSTIAEKLESFVNSFNEDGTLHLKITKVRERNFIGNDEKPAISRYLIFQIV